MARWQRSARFGIAIFAVVFAVFVGRQLKRRDPPPVSAPVARTDPGAVVETTGGKMLRFNRERETVSVEYQKQLTYGDGTSKLSGITIVTAERSGSRTFTISSKEGRVGKDDSAIELDGEVRLVGSDGMTAVTEHATYSRTDSMVRAPGAVDFTRGRIKGNGIGLTWNQTADVLTILEQAVVHIAPDKTPASGADVTAGSAVFARKEKYIRFERLVRIERGGQHIEADGANLYLSDDGNRIETVELKDHSRITTPNAAPGALESLSGRDMNLTYAADGERLEHALISGEALIRIAGAAGKTGREIAANVIDVTLAPDGTTPIALGGREAVMLTFPPETGTPGRTIRSTSLDATGVPGKGLTKALFTGHVQFRESGADVSRVAVAESLEVGLKTGLSGIEQAKFAHGVRFEEGRMAAQAAAATYDPDKGTLALSGSEPAASVPHVVTEQIAVDAGTIDLTLDGPKVKAAGNVKSTLQPSSKAAKPGEAGNDVKMPSMLKQDQPVSVLAANLDYDGKISKGIYTGAARLFQGDTSIKGETIVIDNKAGNLAASGGVTTTTVLETTTKAAAKYTTDPKDAKAGKKQRSHSIATSKELAYDDVTHKLTYLSDAHMSGPEGDMTAARIELYLKPSGDELERAEAYENVTLREQSRETTGTKMIYTTADETYVISGAPVKIVDECKRETTGKTLTFNKGTDRITVDGNSQIRTQTKGGNGNCTS
jgi:LPS export ABC transporter protein LptC